MVAARASEPVVSVVIPLHRPSAAFDLCVRGALDAAAGRDEVIVVTDRPVEGLPPDVVRVTTGSARDTSPAEKRDAALEHVRGSICAFLDDDAYPAPRWIEQALARLEDPSIAAVGGPGLTPPGSGWRERAGGAFYESPFGSGGLVSRFRPLGDARDVDDWPAYNFFVRTDVLRSVGGWGSRFYGGEDTKLCLEIVSAGHRIVYDPDVLVYHHRRPVFRAHMRQVGNVGRHRGYFVRAFPATSARPQYFAPSAALAGALAAVAWSSHSRPRRRVLTGVSAAAAAAMTTWALADGRDPVTAALLPAVVAASHATYGAQFVRGLVTPRIEAM